MCNINQNNALDEQRMLYFYQSLNVVVGLLSKYLDQAENYQRPVDNSLTQRLANASTSDVIAFTFQAMKNGEITHEQYEEIFDIIMESRRTVNTNAWTDDSTSITRR